VPLGAGRVGARAILDEHMPAFSLRRLRHRTHHVRDRPVRACLPAFPVRVTILRKPCRAGRRLTPGHVERCNRMDEVGAAPTPAQLQPIHRCMRNVM
jgi:hypothetical protein